MTSSRTRTLPILTVLVTLSLAAAPRTGLAETAPADSTVARDSPAAPAALLSPGQAGFTRGVLRDDRLRHASLAWTLGVAAGLATGETSVAIVVPFTLGLAKEIDDRGGSGFDTLDLLADLAGALAAGWVISRRSH